MLRLLARKRARSRAGFTLLEVMIALSILAVGLLAVAAAQVTALNMTAKSKYLTDALQLAQEQMETFQAMPLTSLPAAGNYNDPNNPIGHPNPLDATTFQRRWTVQSNTPAVGVTTLTVQVDWLDENGITRTTSLQSMRGL